MAELNCRGLAEFGLPLVTLEDPAFASMVRDIESHPGPWSDVPAFVSDRAAVLLNRSGRAIVGLQCIWRYRTADGKPRTTRFLNFGSSAQREVLSGRSKVVQDLGTFILPGSKRLITEQGIFGNNLDVLTAEELPRSKGYCGGFGSSDRIRESSDAAEAELVLDFAVLEDGLCGGPDESGLYEALNESLDSQVAAAQEAAAALRAGASEGAVFEIIRPLARHSVPEPGSDWKRRRALPFLQVFGNEAVHQLINADRAGLTAFFEKSAQPRALQLHRPL
jgi:hypothetical protein